PQEICRYTPCFEDLRSVHQRIVKVRKDRVSGETDAAQKLALVDAIAWLYSDAAGLHVNQEAVLTILMIEQDEIANVFWILAGWNFWVPDVGGFGIFKPVLGNVVCRCQNDSCTWRV